MRHVVKMKTSSRESFESGDGSPSATRPGHRVGPSMFADNLCSDGFQESESEDASQDYFVDLRVGSKALNASSKGCGDGNGCSDGSSDVWDDCRQGPCVISSLHIRSVIKHDSMCMVSNTGSPVAQIARAFCVKILRQCKDNDGPVSYTHLTLPTNREV